MNEGYLFHFELSQELQEPLEGPLLSVHPDEVDLPELEVGGLPEPPGPLVVARGADGLGLPVLEHERLQDGGERSDADAGGHLWRNVTIVL